MGAFTLVVGLILLAVSVAILVQAIAAPRRGSQDVVDQIGAYGFRGFVSREDSAEPGVRTSLRELPATTGAWVSRRFGTRHEAELRRRLVAAGWYSTTATAFTGYRLLSAIVMTFCFLLLGLAAGMSTAIYVVGVVIAVLFGWYLPSIVLNRKTAERHHAIDRELPELIDLLVVTVEAGIGFNGSLRLAAQELDGPLAQELRLTLQEQSMGLATTEALDNLAYRIDAPGIKSFVRGIIQGETLGVSISQILRNLADEMRKKRKATAEELAQKAPVKMLFPLIFLIFPAMFVVLLLPALLQISKTLGNT
jgi:tight adherence protein C